MKTVIIPCVCFVLVSLVVFPSQGQQPGNWIDDYNVVWDSKSDGSYGSMPIGNGDIGLNVWVEEDGDLLFYISKTDSWSENNRLLKLGRVRVSLDPNPFRKGLPFRQEVKLGSGEIVITAGPVDSEAQLSVWVDANHPEICVDVLGKRESTLEASLEIWRREPREPTKWMRYDKIPRSTAIGDVFNVLPPEHPHTPPGKMIVYPDVVVEGLTDRVMWYHRNEKSVWPLSMKLQGLESLMPKLSDPLLNRTFGGVMSGKGLKSDGPTSLQSVSPSTKHHLAIHLLTKQTPTGEAWREAITAGIETVESLDRDERLAAHREWWKVFWQRSWLCASGTKEAETVSRSYALQRYMTACAGRGAYPIKFNGSIFTVPDPKSGAGDPDYRRWGPGYWFQNTRLVYWPLMSSGDYDLMQPFFRMYRNTLDLARGRTRIYFNHGGAFFGETVYSWGVYANDHYGWKREGKPIDYVVCTQIKRYWQGGLELCALMLDYFDHTQDEVFARETMLPILEAVLEFYDSHYPRTVDGRLKIAPSQALESWTETVNPMPEVAGLHWVTRKACLLPSSVAAKGVKEKWADLRSILPSIPVRTKSLPYSYWKGTDRKAPPFKLKDGLPALAPADVFNKRGNIETPELYAVFPYRLYGVGKPKMELAERAYANSMHPPPRYNRGWQQWPIWAALLGMANDASELVHMRAVNTHKESRFPAMWGPNYDWIPDQDNGGVLLNGFQLMLMQCEGDAIRLFPAWPREWDVRFKLHAAYNTTVEGELKDGNLTALSVIPEERSDDVVVMLAE